MGRIADAAAAQPAPTRYGGVPCRLCTFIDGLDAEDRDDIDALMARPIGTFGHARIRDIVAEQLGVKLSADRIGECRRKGHRGSNR